MPANSRDMFGGVAVLIDRLIDVYTARNLSRSAFLGQT